jgi:hypothetical protein
MAKKPKKTREAKPGELRGIHLMESMERLCRRPESRMDLQRLVTQMLSADGQIYAKHLITSGPSDNDSAAKACGFTLEQLEKAISELEQGIDRIRG